MAVNPPPSDAEMQALRAQTGREGQAVEEVARTEITHDVSDRHQRLLFAIERVRTEDWELLERLGR